MRTYRLDTVLIIRRSVISLIPIDPHQAAAILDLKPGWRGLNNALKVNCAF